MSHVKRAWDEERDQRFSICGRIPQQLRAESKFAVDKTDLREQSWIAYGAWTFCPICGRRRPNGKLILHWQCRGRAAVATPCLGQCDLDPRSLLMTADDAAADDQDQGDSCRKGDADRGRASTKKGCSLKAYITPQERDWPDELHALSATDAKSLS
eukprot:530817-Karenia_brevis.AAC.1